jgi:citrate synthase
MQDQKAILEWAGQRIELPVHIGTENETAIDVSSLRSKTGAITFDPGYGNTGSCESGITFIDGEKGILRHRGYAIEELAEKASFVETAYLLIYGELPTQPQLQKFSLLLNRSSLIHEDMHHFFNGFPRTAHPMGILTTMVASLSSFCPASESRNAEEEQQVLANLISQVRTLAAFSYKKSIGDPIVYPSYKLKYVENFLNMMFSSPVHNFEMDPDVVRAMEVFFILHADHEQNCSTSTVRMVASSLANVYAAVSSGISALWGPLHGGANQQVIQMLEAIQASGGTGDEYVERAKLKDPNSRLMGFGHRVYKNHDPRAKILKKWCDKLINKPGMNDPLFDIAVRLEEIALKDDYFLSRNLFPNVDFYSGLILRAVGIPYDMFTVMFTIGRMPGWLAHWREYRHGNAMRISRPRQIYTGPELRSFVPREDRV